MHVCDEPQWYAWTRQDRVMCGVLQCLVLVCCSVLCWSVAVSCVGVLQCLVLVCCSALCWCDKTGWCAVMTHPCVSHDLSICIQASSMSSQGKHRFEWGGLLYQQITPSSILGMLGRLWIVLSNFETILALYPLQEIEHLRRGIWESYFGCGNRPIANNPLPMSVWHALLISKTRHGDVQSITEE